MVTVAVFNVAVTEVASDDKTVEPFIKSIETVSLDAELE
jgi:hypothetical protein